MSTLIKLLTLVAFLAWPITTLVHSCPSWVESNRDQVIAAQLR